MSSPTTDARMEPLATLATLWADYETVAAPYKAQLRALEVAMAEATAELSY